MHKTKNPNDNYLGSGKILLNAIEKYGKENFRKEILFIFYNDQEMRQCEESIVTEEFIARKDTYNLRIGGKGGFDYINNNNIKKFHGKTHSKEAKRKVGKFQKSENLAGRGIRYYNNQTKEEYINNGRLGGLANRGKPKTEEHRKRISESIKEKWKEKKLRL